MKDVEKPGMPTIGFASLFIIIFSNVGSGPAGIEGVVGSAGLSIGVIGILIFPFFWGYVQAILALELSLKYKRFNGALGAWSKNLFGSPAALNSSLWFTALQCSTAALVSEIIVAYVRAYVPGSLESYGARQGVTIGIILVAFLINLISVSFASKMFWVFSFNSLAAFTAMCIISIPRVQLRRFDNPAVTGKNIKWPELINLLVYNSAGYDSASSTIKFVKNPRTTVPRAMVAVGVAITFIYVLTLTLPFLATNDPYQNWQPGYYVVVAQELGGNWLSTWILVACVGTCVQSYTAALQAAAYSADGMAKEGILPKWLASTHSSGVPRAALCACAFASVLFGLAPLLVNLSIEAVLYGAIMLLEIACFLRMSGKEQIFAPENLNLRRALIVPCLVLVAYTISIQNTYVLFATIATLACIAVVSIPQEKRERRENKMEADDVVGFFVTSSEGMKI